MDDDSRSAGADDVPASESYLEQWLPSGRSLLLLAGFAIWAFVVVTYERSGAHDILVLFFVLAIVTVAMGFPGRARAAEELAIRINWRDLAVAGVLLAGFAPLYLIDLHDTPWDVNTDELAISDYSEQVASTEPKDPFGVSSYFGFPNLTFLVHGEFADLAGGINLTNMRLVHALFGLAAIAACYALFRTSFDRLYAAVAAVVVGVNHSFLAISRMAMRENSSLLAEAVALSLLFYGLWQRSLRATFAGGAVAGLSFYVYYPGRATIFIWLVFLAASIFLLRDRLPLREALRHCGTALFGFVMLLVPLVIASSQSEYGNDALEFSKQRLLLLPEGREYQADWVSADSELDGAWRNISDGLTAFNSPVGDQGNIYVNPGDGFVDPLTGILLWLGLVFIALQLFRSRQRRAGDLLAIIGFAALYLSSAFLVGQAPSYTRLLVILPFVAYASTRAIQSLATVVGRSLDGRASRRIASAGRHATVGLLTVAVVTWNIFIFIDYATTSRDEGNNVGSTGRYVEARKDIEGYNFYLVADQEHPYFGFGEESAWRNWIDFFADDELALTIDDPDSFTAGSVLTPFTLFTSSSAWAVIGEQFSARYPDAVTTDIQEERGLTAVEVK